MTDPRYKASIRILVEQRRKLGLSQAQLGGKLGRIQQFVAKYELLERRLDFIEYCDIAHALGLDGPVEISRCWTAPE